MQRIVVSMRGVTMAQKRAADKVHGHAANAWQGGKEYLPALDAVCRNAAQLHLRLDFNPPVSYNTMDEY